MWIKQDNELSYTASELEALKEIPVGIWLLKFSPTKGFYLETTPNFRFPKKIYGDSEAIAKRYLNTFKHQDNNLGILLTGLKGTGKSVTAKLTCMMSKIPVILVTEPFTGDGFKSFLSNIRQEVIVFVDEFEKVYYNQEVQNSFLSILDGIFDGKKMFLFTSNEKGRINEYMINRPGRVHYLKEYSELSSDIINDVIDDNLKLKENKVGLLEVLSILSNVTMDMVMSLIKEMNLYGETARESVRFLNLRPEKQSFDCVVFTPDNLRLGGTSINHHPLATELISLQLYVSDITKYKIGATNHDNLITEINHYRMSNGLEPVPITPIKNKVWNEDLYDWVRDPEEEIESVKNEVSEGISINLNKYSSPMPVMEIKEAKRKRKRTEPSAEKARAVEKPHGTIYFSLNVKKMKVETDGTKVGNMTFVDGHGNRFVFEKSKPYYYAF